MLRLAVIPERLMTTRMRKTTDMIRRYSDLQQLRSFEERFEYLSLKGVVGQSTFGYERYINQSFYASTEWRQIRNHVIARDNGCDLGAEGYEIYDRIYVHHMNPMTIEDIEHGNADILNLEYLISTTHRTHNAIHFGDASLLPQKLVERRPGDTNLW